MRACVQIPNGCGSFLGAVQLVLYAIYRNSGGKAGAAGAAGKQQQAGDDVEMAASDAKSSKKVADDGKEDRLV